MGIKVKEPTFIPFNPWNRRFNIRKVIKDFVRNQREKPTMILILIENKLEKLYRDIKELTIKKLGILTQVVKKESLMKKDRGVRRNRRRIELSVVSNIVK